MGEAKRELVARGMSEELAAGVAFLEAFRARNGATYADWLASRLPLSRYRWTHAMILAIGLHSRRCGFRAAATRAPKVECAHGYAACPVCDRCDCGAVDGPLDHRLLPVE